MSGEHENGMNIPRHIFGLALAILLAAALYYAWTMWPMFARLDFLRPIRGILLEWRIPILVIGGFLFFTLIEWGYTKLTTSDSH